MDLTKSDAFPRGPERKLTPDQEAELVTLYRAKVVRPKVLRERFGICKATLYNIVNRATPAKTPGDAGA